MKFKINSVVILLKEIAFHGILKKTQNQRFINYFLMKKEKKKFQEQKEDLIENTIPRNVKKQWNWLRN